MVKFSEFIAKYAEWKEANHPGQEMDEYDMSFIRESYAAAVKAEEKALKEGKEESKAKTEAPINEAKETEFQKALKAFAEFKESKGLGPVTRSERVRIFEKTRSEKSKIVENKVTVKGVFDKLNESKKCVALAKKRLSEGDVMGAADATMAAGAAVTGAEGDANAMATPTAPVPQEVVDQISQVKTAVDALAAQAGIASPVDMGADPNAGVPAVTGAPADPNAAAAAPAAPVMESRIEASKARIAEGKDEQAKPAIEIPSEKELVKGTATGASKEAEPADTWPTKPLNEVPVGKKLGNVEESTEPAAEENKEPIKESEEFTPDTEDKPAEKVESNEKVEESTETAEKPAQGLAEQRLEAELAKRNFKWGDFLKSGFNKR